MVWKREKNGNRQKQDVSEQVPVEVENIFKDLFKRTPGTDDLPGEF